MVTGPDGVPIEGCQVGQVPTQIVLNFPTLKFPLNGHTATEKYVEAVVGVVKDGDHEKINYGFSDVVFDLTVGKKTYSWSSTSGTISTKAMGDGGSFDAHLVQSGDVPGGNPYESGSATKPVHVIGAWSSCHPW